MINITRTHPVSVHHMITDILARHERLGAQSVAEELLGLGVRHVESDADGALPVFTDHLQHLQAVHAELRHQRHVVLHVLVVVVQVVQVGAVNQHTLTPEVVTLIVFI